MSGSPLDMPSASRLELAEQEAQAASLALAQAAARLRMLQTTEAKEKARPCPAPIAPRPPAAVLSEDDLLQLAADDEAMPLSPTEHARLANARQQCAQLRRPSDEQTTPMESARHYAFKLVDFDGTRCVSPCKGNDTPVATGEGAQFLSEFISHHLQSPTHGEDVARHAHAAAGAASACAVDEGPGRHVAQPHEAEHPVALPPASVSPSNAAACSAEEQGQGVSSSEVNLITSSPPDGAFPRAGSELKLVADSRPHSPYGYAYLGNAMPSSGRLAELFHGAATYLLGTGSSVPPDERPHADADMDAEIIRAV